MRLDSAKSVAAPDWRQTDEHKPKRADDQREMNRKILDGMKMPRAQRELMEKTLIQTARRLIDAMPDADVRECFK